jgi:hypothetical protein
MAYLYKHEARYVSQAALARRWNVTVRTIFNYGRRGMITPLMLGTTVRFAISQIEAIEAARGTKQ